MYSDDEILAKAFEILSTRIKVADCSLSSPAAVKKYLVMKTATLEREVFGGLFLNVKNMLIEDVTLAIGSLDSASVYPREVAKTALQLNAAAVIFYHNHPSGTVDPSTADKTLTTGLRSSLALFDVRVLDHIIVAGLNTYSFAENGLV